jgi:hypothetical protein
MPTPGPVIAVCFGIVVSGVYAWRGGLPDRLRAPTIRVGSFETELLRIHEPDDPSNLSYKIVAPVLLVVVGGGALVVVGLLLGWW